MGTCTRKEEEEEEGGVMGLGHGLEFGLVFGLDLDLFQRAIMG